MNRSRQVLDIHNALQITAAELEAMRAYNWDRVEPVVKTIICELAGYDYPENCAPRWSQFDYAQRNAILKACKLLEKAGQEAAIIR